MRVPDVEMGAERPQQIVDSPRAQQVVARGVDVRERGRPRTVRRRPRSINASAGSSVLSGICTASTPPFGSAVQQPRQHRGMIRHPLEHGVAEQQVGARLRRSRWRDRPRRTCSSAAARAPAAACRARSRPRSPRRSETARSAARSNCPARSRDRPRAAAIASGTCASRSRGGRVRSSSNLRYCRAAPPVVRHRLSARELLVLDPVRDGRIGAQPAHLVLPRSPGSCPRTIRRGCRPRRRGCGSRCGRGTSDRG